MWLTLKKFIKKINAKRFLSLIVLLFAAVYIANNIPTADQFTRLFSLSFVFAILTYSGVQLLTRSVQILKWGMLIRQEIPIQPFNFIAVVGWQYFLISILPVRSGELSKPIWVKLNGGSGSRSLGMLLVEKTVDILSIIAVAWTVIWLVPDMLPDQNKIAPHFLLLTVVVGLTVLIVIGRIGPERIESITQRITSLLNFNKLTITNRLHSIVIGITRASQLKFLLPLFFLSVCMWIFTTLSYFFFLTYFLPEFSWGAAFGITVLAGFASLFSVGGGNIGVFEAAVIFTLSMNGYSETEALVYAIGLRVAITFFNMVTGGICYTMLKTRRFNSQQ
jgi:uncharacterized membrane protein YbhN (UPF0104 family)